MKLSIILIRSPGDAGYNVTVVPVEARGSGCSLTSSWGSADEIQAVPHHLAWGCGEMVAWCFSCFVIIRLACLWGMSSNVLQFCLRT